MGTEIMYPFREVGYYDELLFMTADKIAVFAATFWNKSKYKSESILSGNILDCARMYPAVLWLFWLPLYKKALPLQKK